MVGTVKINRSTKTSNRKVAEQLEAKWINEVHAEVVVKGKMPVPLYKAIDEFTSSRQHMKSGDNCRIRLAPFKSIPDQSLHKVTAKQSQEVIERMLSSGKKLSTAAASVSYWNAMLTYCAAKGYSVCDKLERIKGVKGRVRFLTPDEETRLLATIRPDQKYSGKNADRDAMRQHNWDFVCLLLDTGARYSEIADMQWNQVDFDAGTVTVLRQKGGRDTVLRMTTRMHEILKRRYDARTDNNVMVRPANEQNWWDAAIERAEISVVPTKPTLHTLRHTFAVRFCQRGGQLHTLQGLLGHVDINTTLIYAHFTVGDAAQQAADIMNRVHGDRVAVRPVPVVQPVLRVV